jgi:hypothetical protein
MTLNGTWIWRPGNFGWHENPGECSTDNQTWIGASTCAISTQTSDGIDVSDGLNAIEPGDVMQLKQDGADEPFVNFTILDYPAKEGPDYVLLSISVLSGVGLAPPDGTLLDIVCPYAAPPEPPASDVISWRITPAREPNRYWVRADCEHGAIGELMATADGVIPVPAQFVPSTACNLKRHTGCDCFQLDPPVDVAGIGPQAYVQLSPQEVHGP